MIFWPVKREPRDFPVIECEDQAVFLLWYHVSCKAAATLMQNAVGGHPSDVEEWKGAGPVKGL